MYILYNTSILVRILHSARVIQILFRYYTPQDHCSMYSLLLYILIYSWPILNENVIIYNATIMYTRIKRMHSKSCSRSPICLLGVFAIQFTKWNTPSPYVRLSFFNACMWCIIHPCIIILYMPSGTPPLIFQPSFSPVYMPSKSFIYYRCVSNNAQQRK